jgi:hypothetical protein
VSPTNPPGAPRDNPDGGRDDWQRRQRATVRRSRRADPQAQPPAEADPYGWNTVHEGSPGRPDRTPPAEYRGVPQAGRPESGRPERARPETGGRPEGGRPAPADPRGWGTEPGWAGEPARTPDPGRGWQGEPRPGDRPGADPRQTGQRPSGQREWLRPDERLREAGRRLRGPHRRRAVDGQLTGLDPSLQSDLPSWLEQRGEEQVPVHRLLSLSVAAFAALLATALTLGAYTLPKSYALVILGVQVLFILSWTATLRPAGPRVVAGVALIAAVAADLAAVLPTHASLAPIGLVTAGAFAVAVIGQLLRGADRSQVTESLGGTLIVVVGVVCFAMLVVLIRHSPGTPAVVTCLVAAGVALVVARLTDIVLPSPRTSPQVQRGTIGVILGAMAGTVAAGYMGSVLVGLHPPRAAVAGLVTALVAVLADLAVSYAEAGRALAGEPSPLWIARHMQGPLGGFALAAPAAYVLSVMVLVTNLN